MSVSERLRGSRERLHVVADRLGNRTIEMEGGWTASALLAHIAFWDRLAAVRLEKYLRDGETPIAAPSALTDLTNGAGIRQWLDTPPATAAAQARDAAEAMDRLAEGLSRERIAAFDAEGRPHLYDRSNHRNEHLEQIERALT